MTMIYNVVRARLVRPDRGTAGSTRWLAAGYGVMAGIAGAFHGIGEMLQGDSAPGGIVFESWVHEPIATNLGGEPAMTVVPNLLLTGVLTVLASVAVLAWAAAGVGRRWYGRVLVALSLVMLLVGGGFGPPILGLLGALAGSATHARHGRWTKRLSGPLGAGLSRAWPSLSWVALADVAFLGVGPVTLAVLLDVNAPMVFVYALFLAVVVVPVATLAGVAHDVARRGDALAARKSHRRVGDADRQGWPPSRR